MTIKKGLDSTSPESTAPFAGMGNMYFDSVKDFGKAFDPKEEMFLSKKRDVLEMDHNNTGVLTGLLSNQEIESFDVSI
ncbi:MAG: hypothetical protein ABJF11_13695 [Reichenbachiella sp.]|uniref:hypothetical protein n=1 Tax=Reichenbachiella sp. TaxID=2184521 RepID=UPI0032652A19